MAPPDALILPTINPCGGTRRGRGRVPLTAKPPEQLCRTPSAAALRGPRSSYRCGPRRTGLVPAELAERRPAVVVVRTAFELGVTQRAEHVLAVLGVLAEIGDAGAVGDIAELERTEIADV